MISELHVRILRSWQTWYNVYLSKRRTGLQSVLVSLFAFLVLLPSTIGLKDKLHKTKIDVNTLYLFYNWNLPTAPPPPPPSSPPYQYGSYPLSFLKIDYLSKLLKGARGAYVEHTHFFSAKSDTGWGSENCSLDLLDRKKWYSILLGTLQHMHF